MTLVLRDELEAAATAASPHSELVARSRQAGQRQLTRRRRRALAGAGAAVAAVAVGSSMLPNWWAPNQRAAAASGSSPTASATPVSSKTAAPVVAVTGTAADWLVALEQSMPYSDRTKAVSASTNGPANLSKSSSVQAVFRYTRDGRTTTLVVTAFANGTQASHGTSALDAVLASCDQSGVSCDPVQETVTGPVLILHASNRGFVEALSFRASGVVVVARFPIGDTTAGQVQLSEGLAGFTGNLDELVNIAALTPEPELEDASGGASGTAASTP